MSTIELVPALFTYNAEELPLLLRRFAEVPRLHLDIMDGEFTERASVSLQDLLAYKENLPSYLEAHLMVMDPLSYLSGLRKLGVQKVLLHWESFETDSDLQFALDEFSSKGFELALVLNPGTEITEVKDYLSDFSSVMLMGVWPGAQGQQLISWTYARIRETASLVDIPIQVDGGVNLQNATDLVNAGASILTLGSSVAKASSPSHIIAQFEQSFS